MSLHCEHCGYTNSERKVGTGMLCPRCWKRVPGDAAARKSDPITSHVAASKMRSKTGAMESLVVEALQSLGGKATAFQVASWIQRDNPEIDSNTISPRFKPLERKRRIERTDERGPGRSSGRSQMVWQLTEQQ